MPNGIITVSKTIWVGHPEHLAMVQHGAIVPQVQYLPNTALLVAELQSLGMEVLLCAVHLLCA